jgi:hypothetical protein
MNFGSPSIAMITVTWWLYRLGHMFSPTLLLHLQSLTVLSNRSMVSVSRLMMNIAWYDALIVRADGQPTYQPTNQPTYQPTNQPTNHLQITDESVCVDLLVGDSNVTARRTTTPRECSSRKLSSNNASRRIIFCQHKPRCHRDFVATFQRRRNGSC